MWATGCWTRPCPGPCSPPHTPDAIIPATIAANSGAGVVHIVKNYTGDVLNFETAAEMAQAEGVEVRTVLVNDDVAVEDSLYTAGRRGVAGTVLVEKIAGAAAERGDNLDAVAAIGQRVNDNVRSMGVALSACTVPHAGVPSFELAEDEIEIGIGIHGEPGRHRIPMENADGITDTAARTDPGRPCPRGGGQGAPVRQRHGRHPGQRAVHCVPARRQGTGRRPGWWWSARSWATTSRPWKCRAAPFRCCAWTMK